MILSAGHEEKQDWGTVSQYSVKAQHRYPNAPVKIDSVDVQRLSCADSLWSHGLQATRLPHPSPSLGVCSNSCALRQWCHPTISSSVVPFSSCLQSFPASGHFYCLLIFKLVFIFNFIYSLSKWILDFNIDL